jgi:hypothetical protein
VEQAVTWGFRSATSRFPEDNELEILLSGYRKRLVFFLHNPQAAQALLSQGESLVADHLPKGQLAALTTVASVILNLDEVINK